ncbi:MAG: glycosyltransferase family 2 protein [Deltaproteobacteria bacterium]|nr:glycosyltransferase family 2 protein [Deltaproteobacteria bacterium]
MASGRAVSVIAPCFNEEGNVAELVRRVLPVLAALGAGSELVLVDDGSRDRTWEKIRGCAGRDPRIVPVHHEENRGIEAAWRSGLAAASGELVCLIDADLQNRPEDILRLYARLGEAPEVDIVQGVRRPAQGVRRHQIFTRALGALLNASFGMKLRDNKSGFLFCPRAVLERILVHRYRYRYFQAFVGASAGARGLRVGEVETVFEPRRAGSSFLSRLPVLVSARICWELAKFRWETARERPSGP